MSPVLLKPAAIVTLVVVGLAVTIAPSARAEVGTLELEAGGPYVVGIIDDPDPVGRAWKRYSTPGSGRIVLNEAGETNGDGDPSLAFNPVTRTPIVAWARNSAEGFDVVVSRFSGGEWSPPVVLAGSPLDELDPWVAVDPVNGTVHVVYWIDDSTPRVVHRSAPADLSVWSAPRDVSPAGEHALRPSAVVGPSCVLRVAYESHGSSPDGTPRLIVLATDAGGSFETRTVGSSDHAGPNRPEVHAEPGRVWVDWVDGADTMTWTREGLDGTWEAPSGEPYGGSEDRDYFVRGRIRALVRE